MQTSKFQLVIYRELTLFALKMFESNRIFHSLLNESFSADGVSDKTMSAGLAPQSKTQLYH